jgi:ABC-type Fe3+-citrate transport system substrate-binding protein
MEEIQITISTVLSIFGAFAIIASGVKAIANFLSPFKEIKSRLDVHDKKIEDHDRFLANDKQAIGDIRTMARQNTRVNLSLLNHFIDGNGVDKMKEIREELQDSMYNGD